MLMRIAVLAVVVVALAGCVLQSREPLIGATEGALPLSAYGTRFTSYSPEGDGWKQDAEPVTMVADGSRYAAAVGTEEAIAISFQHIKDTWWLIQGSEKDGLYAYILADMQPGQIVSYPIACDNIRKEKAFEALVDYKGNDCFIKEGADTAALLNMLIQNPGKAVMKLVPQG